MTQYALIESLLCIRSLGTAVKPGEWKHMQSALRNRWERRLLLLVFLVP